MIFSLTDGLRCQCPAVLGLDLGLPKDLYEQHQSAAWKANVNEWGLAFWSNKSRDYSCEPLPGGQARDLFTDDTVWSAHAVDEGALALLLGKVPAVEALEMASRTYAMYRTQLRDQWDFRDVGAVREDGPDGTAGIRPYCNSHYTRHLLGLHAIPMALTGQRYDAGRGELSFAPRREVVRSGGWPLSTPQGSGLVRELSGGCASVHM